MKTSELVEKDVQNTIGAEHISGMPETNGVAKIGKHLRTIFYITSLAGIGVCFNACTSLGYVSSEPVSVEYQRPAQPSNLHVWINGDWAYNQHSHVYVQKHGHWEKPNRRRTYVSGHWQSSPQGQYWVSGYYQRNGR